MPDTLEQTKPQAIADILTNIRDNAPRGRGVRLPIVFILRDTSSGSVRVIAVGDTYDAMWVDAQQRTGREKNELIKSGMTFDVMGVDDAEALEQ